MFWNKIVENAILLHFILFIVFVDLCCGPIWILLLIGPFGSETNFLVDIECKSDAKITSSVMQHLIVCDWTQP